MLLTAVSTCLPISRMSILLELLQKLLAVPKVVLWFPSVFRMWVTFPFHKVSLTSLFQYPFDFKFVFFFSLEMECCLQRGF
jgi:hypothetical protein